MQKLCENKTMYQPKYTITNKILKDIGLVEAAREVVDNAPLIPSWEAKFREEAIIRTVHYGTHLEGNELNFTEAAQVLQGKEIVGRDRDIQEVLNYRNVLKFIGEFPDRQLNNGDRNSEAANTIGEKAIKHIHKLTTEKILEPQQCGQFRSGQVVVKNSQTGEITFRPPPALEVPFLVKDFCQWINSLKTREIHPVMQASIAHYELVRIHPFVDGNGRVARAVATLLLFTQGYDIKKFFSLEEHYDKDAQGYYTALQSVSQENGDLTKWMEYFVEGLAIEFNRIKEKVQKLSVDIKLKNDLGGKQVALNERQLKLVEYIQSNGFVQSQIFREMFPNWSNDTIIRDLNALIKQGVIKKEGSTKGAKYVMVK